LLTTTAIELPARRQFGVYLNRIRAGARLQASAAPAAVLKSAALPRRRRDGRGVEPDEKEGSDHSGADRAGDPRGQRGPGHARQRPGEILRCRDADPGSGSKAKPRTIPR